MGREKKREKKQEKKREEKLRQLKLGKLVGKEKKELKRRKRNWKSPVSLLLFVSSLLLPSSLVSPSCLKLGRINCSNQPTNTSSPSSVRCSRSLLSLVSFNCSSSCWLPQKLWKTFHRPCLVHQKRAKTILVNL